MPLFACARGASPNRPYPPPGDVHVGYVFDYERCRVTIGLVRPYLGAKSAPSAAAIRFIFAIGHHQIEKRRSEGPRAQAALLHPLADVRRLRTGSSSY